MSHIHAYKERRVSVLVVPKIPVVGRRKQEDYKIKIILKLMQLI